MCLLEGSKKTPPSLGALQVSPVPKLIFDVECPGFPLVFFLLSLIL